jgi:hypothetical protein
MREKMNVQIDLSKCPAFIELGPEGFRDAEAATVAEWKTALRHKGEPPLPKSYRSAVSRMVRVAKLLDLPDDCQLLPRVRALAAANVRSLSVLSTQLR